MQKTIYFDNAATTRVLPEVVEAMLPYYTEFYGNPSSIHALGRKSRSVVEKARKSIAKQLNASTGEIFFTAGGTESNNTVLKRAVHDLGVTRIITSKLEHHCTMHTTEFLQKEYGIQLEYVKNDELGFFDLNHLDDLLKASDKKTLVSLIHANNEVGTVNDIVAIGKLIKSNGAYFHADTVQAIAHFPFDLQEIPIDFIASSAHKYHGPKGVGFLYINSDVSLQPYIHGGGQERNMRAGTENLASIVGMQKAFELYYEHLEERTTIIRGLKDYMRSELENNFEGISFNGDVSENSLYTILNVAVPLHIASDMLMFNLDMRGVCCSAGSACSSGADTGSHVIRALGRNTDKASVRFSFNHENTKEEVDEVIHLLKQI